MFGKKNEHQSSTPKNPSDVSQKPPKKLIPLQQRTKEKGISSGGFDYMDIITQNCSHKILAIHMPQIRSS